MGSGWVCAVGHYSEESRKAVERIVGREGLASGAGEVPSSRIPFVSVHLTITRRYTSDLGSRSQIKHPAFPRPVPPRMFVPRFRYLTNNNAPYTTTLVLPAPLSCVIPSSSPLLLQQSPHPCSTRLIHQFASTTSPLQQRFSRMLNSRNASLSVSLALGGSGECEGGEIVSEYERKSWAGR